LRTPLGNAPRSRQGEKLTDGKQALSWSSRGDVMWETSLANEVQQLWQRRFGRCRRKFQGSPWWKHLRQPSQL